MLLKKQLKDGTSAADYAKGVLIIDSIKVGNFTRQKMDTGFNALFNPAVQPYMYSWMKYDPQQAIRKLNIPILIVQGTNDIQVSVNDAKTLKKAKSDAHIMHLNIIKSQEKIVDIQTLSKKWNYLLIPLLLMVIYLYPVKSFLLTGVTIETLIPVLIISVIWAIFTFTTLRTEISATEIIYKLSPFHLHSKKIELKDIKQIQIVPLAALLDFGGWGVRYNPGNKTMGYIIKGDKGILIIKKSGKKILLSTTLLQEKLQPFLNTLNSDD